MSHLPSRRSPRSGACPRAHLSASATWKRAAGNKDSKTGGERERREGRARRKCPSCSEPHFPYEHERHLPVCHAPLSFLLSLFPLPFSLSLSLSPSLSLGSGLSPLRRSLIHHCAPGVPKDSGLGAKRRAELLARPVSKAEGGSGGAGGRAGREHPGGRMLKRCHEAPVDLWKRGGFLRSDR